MSVERILLAVDESQASELAVDYAGSLLGGAPEAYLHLVHVEPVRASHSDPEDPEFRSKRDASATLLARLRARLVERGVSEEHVDTGFLAMPDGMKLEEALMEIALDQRCGTIVLGRNALPWYRERFHHHPADALTHKAHGITLWVVAS